MESRVLPEGCADTETCLEDSVLVMRNLVPFERSDIRKLLGFLNETALSRDIPHSHMAAVTLPEAWPYLHEVPMAERSQLLADHPGVYFDPVALDSGAETGAFSVYVMDELKKVGLKFLTAEEHALTPGRPTLTVRYSARKESAGCIIPWSVSVSIKEEVALIRDSNLKLSTTVWSGSSRQNLANTNLTIQDSLTDAIAKLVADIEMSKAAEPVN